MKKTSKKSSAMKFEVGDLVQLNEKAKLLFWKEEARIGVTYKVESVSHSPHCDPYVQLEGIKSSYKFSWIKKADINSSNVAGERGEQHG